MNSGLKSPESTPRLRSVEWPGCQLPSTKMGAPPHPIIAFSSETGALVPGGTIALSAHSLGLWIEKDLHV